MSPAWDKFDPALHYSALERWFCEWDEISPPRDSLAKCGVVVDGLAMGFLYRTDGKMGIIENLVSNPRAPKGLRNEALDIVILALLDEAKRLKMDCVFGFTAKSLVAKRAVRLGFKQDGRSYTLLAKGI